MDSMQIEDRQVVTLLAFDAQDAGGHTLATASLQHVYGSLYRTRLHIHTHEG